MPVMNEQLELAILKDVVNRFVHLNESTARRAILIKYKNQPAAEVLQNLVNQISFGAKALTRQPRMRNIYQRLLHLSFAEIPHC